MEAQTLPFPLDLLPPTTLDRLLSLGRWEEGDQGWILLEEGGGPAQGFHVLAEGEVELLGGGERVARLGPGHFLGLPSLLLQEPPRYTVRAATRIRVLTLPREALPLLLEHPQVAQTLLEDLAGRLRYRREEAFLFRPAVSLLRRPPAFIPTGATVQEAAQRMAQEKISSLLVEGETLGILTDRDLRNRVLARGLGPETLVAEVMTTPTLTLPAETPIFEALAFMAERGIHHLPLTQGGKVVGVVTHTDLVQAQTQSPLFLLKRIERLDLEAYAEEIARLTEGLLEGGVPALRVGEAVAGLNDALIRRLLKEAEAELGPPPFPYAFIVYGSEGRREQALLTDQDNGLVLAGEGEEGYFAALAERVVEGLHRAGFPYCPGGYMATRERRSLEAWLETFRRHMEDPEPQALLEAQIYFDFRKVHGELDLTPLEDLILQRAQKGVFLYHLARAALEFRPPLGLFGRIQAPGGEVDLKRGGIASIVALGRLYGLLAGVRGPSTRVRLLSAAQKGALGQATAEGLLEAYAFLFELRLKHQLQALRRGEKPSNKVRLKDLTPREVQRLKEGFQLIAQVQESVARRFQVR